MRDIRALVDERDDIQTGKEAETLASQMDPIWYACPVCGDIYDTVDEAAACRDQPFDTGGLKVGDIVIVPSKWNVWMDTDDPWIAFTLPSQSDSDDHFEHKPRLIPYYVVTAVHGDARDPHRCVVTLVTLCGGELSVGWNPANGDGHCAMFRIDGGKHCDAESTWIETIEPYLKKCKPSEQMLEEAARLARVGISTRNLL